MNKIWILALSMAMAQAASAADAPPANAAPAVAEPAASAAPSTMPNGNFCLYGTSPAGAAYSNLGPVKIKKGTYGGVRDELPTFVAEARARGADAVTNYNGAQRFGFWPWRMVRPVLTGVAIKFDGGKVPDCAATGGSTLATVMSTNLEPTRK